jgi:sRNA-binding carbon storage regulator CsrA
MLVLTRKRHEEIVIRDQSENGQVVAVITLVEVRGSDRAKIGIEAESRYAVYRREVDESRSPASGVASSPVA